MSDPICKTRRARNARGHALLVSRLRGREVTRGFSTDATKTVYVYDEAGRTTEIRHDGLVGPSTLHQTTYTWNLNNTLASRVETDNFGLTVATVEFTYDNRDRLIREEREQAYNGGSAATAYDYRYGYDQLGNRKWRIDAATSERPAYYYTYEYDTDVDPGTMDFPTKNNRLLQYEIRKDSSSGDLLRTVSYTYYKTGHASNITVKDWYVDSSTTPGSASDYDWYYDLALYYFTNGSLRLAMNDKWKVYVDGGTGQSTITDYTSLTAREFRYDGIGIARYLAVDYNTNNEPTDPSQWSLVGSPTLTDYAGSMPLTDSSIAYSSSYSATAETRYFAGDGRQSLGSGGSVADLRYFHGDLIDSRVLATDDSAATLATTAYTAFGDAVTPIGSPSRPAGPSSLETRYQYAGGIDYESDMLGVRGPNTDLAAISLSHVGARWYQADTQRFCQRASIELVNLNQYKDDPPPKIRPGTIGGAAVGGGLGAWVKAIVEGVLTARKWTKAGAAAAGGAAGGPVGLVAGVATTYLIDAAIEKCSEPWERKLPSLITPSNHPCRYCARAGVPATRKCPGHWVDAPWRAGQPIDDRHPEYPR